MPLDVVVGGTGTLKGDLETYVVKAPFNGYVEQVGFRPRSRVARDDLLLRLKPSTSTNDLASIDERIARSSSRVAELKEVLAALRNGTAVSTGVDVQLVANQRIALEQQQAAGEARIDQTAKAAALAERNMVLFRDRLEAIESLAAKGFVAKAALTEVQAQFTSAEVAMVAARANHSQAVYELEQIRAQKGVTRSQAIAQYESELRALEDRIAELRSSRQAAAQYEQMAVVRAPFAGYVDQIYPLFAETPISAGQDLISVVPSSTSFRVIANVDNADVGKVEVGQEVRVRLRALSQSRYRSFRGKVTRVSDQAVPTPEGMEMLPPAGRRPPEYLVDVALEPDPKLVLVSLKSGMAADVQIITGKRVVAAYLLRPLGERLGPVFAEP